MLLKPRLTALPILRPFLQYKHDPLTSLTPARLLMLLLNSLLTVLPPFQLHHPLMKLVRLTLLTMLSTLFVKLLCSLPWFQQYIQVSLAILMRLRTCTMQRIKFMLTVPPTLSVFLWDDPVDFIMQRREIFSKTKTTTRPILIFTLPRSMQLRRVAFTIMD